MIHDLAVSIRTFRTIHAWIADAMGVSASRVVVSFSTDEGTDVMVDGVSIRDAPPFGVSDDDVLRIAEACGMREQKHG